MHEMKVAPPEGATPVTPEVIATYAKPSCRYCGGSGNVTRLVGKHGGPVCWDEGVVRQTSICGCAVKRFAKKESERFVLIDGIPFWKDGEANAQSSI